MANSLDLLHSNSNATCFESRETYWLSWQKQNFLFQHLHLFSGYLDYSTITGSRKTINNKNQRENWKESVSDKKRLLQYLLNDTQPCVIHQMRMHCKDSGGIISLGALPALEVVPLWTSLALNGDLCSLEHELSSKLNIS